MNLIPYNKEDFLSIRVAFKCPHYGYYTAFMNCPVCSYFPCKHLTDQDLKMLDRSPLMDKTLKSLTKRRIKKMYIIKKYDGTLEKLDSLDEKNPDPEKLKDVEEVYVISKVLVPVMTLKPKTKEEQHKIIKAAKDAKTTDAKTTKEKKQRNNSKQL